MSVIRPQPELAAVKALLDAVQLPTSDLTDRHCDHFFFWGTAASPSGLVGLEMLGDVALLRSLAVLPDSRSSGMGSALVRHAENHARTHGVHTMYLLTTTAESFFLRLGYTPAQRDAAPDAIRATREFAGMCPASAAFLAKQL